MSAISPLCGASARLTHRAGVRERHLLEHTCRKSAALSPSPTLHAVQLTHPTSRQVRPPSAYLPLALVARLAPPMLPPTPPPSRRRRRRTGLPPRPRLLVPRPPSRPRTRHHRCSSSSTRRNTAHFPCPARLPPSACPWAPPPLLRPHSRVCLARRRPPRAPWAADPCYSCSPVRPRAPRVAVPCLV